VSDGTLTVRVIQGERPVRHPGQENVPMEQLRKEPWFLARCRMEFGAGAADKDTAILATLAYLFQAHFGDWDVNVVLERAGEFGATTYEGAPEPYGKIVGGAQAQVIKLGEDDNPPYRSDDTQPLPRHFTPGRRPSRGQRHVRKGGRR
jgi:hypothetical protein